MTIKLEDIDTVILCGGLGTRLKDVTKKVPKPMVDVHGQPFLDLVINYASSFGLKRFILCSGYKGEIIAEHYKNKNDGLEYIMSEEDAPLGTGGALIHARSLIKSKIFLGLNGDSFCQIDLNKFFKSHIEKRATVSIALTSIDDPRDYGSISLNNNQKVTEFHEKNTTKDDGKGLINAGIYLFNKSSMAPFPSEKNISLENDIFPGLVKNGLYGFVDNARLFDIGTPQRLNTLREYFNPGVTDET